MADTWYRKIWFLNRRKHAKHTNIGEEIRRLMHRSDIDNKLKAAMPVLVASVVAWPTVWVYRAFTWPTKRGQETLPFYIRKTFYQAKAVQFAVIAIGVMYMLMKDAPNMQPMKIRNIADTKDAKA